MRASLLSFHLTVQQTTSANILLDKSFTAKLGDFGLAREIPFDESTASYINLHSEHTPGTLGYLANEYVTTKKLSAQVFCQTTCILS